jgi:hypothetical protein
MHVPLILAAKVMFMSIKYSIMFIALLALLSCGADKSSLLVRTWKVKDLKYSQEVPEAMRPTIQHEIERLRKSYTITYNADKTYKALMDGTPTLGKWSLNFNSTKITSIGPDGKAVEYKILELTDKNFTFEAIEAGQKVIFILEPA